MEINKMSLMTHITLITYPSKRYQSGLRPVQRGLRYIRAVEKDKQLMKFMFRNVENKFSILRNRNRTPAKYENPK
jgi:hypothetical protein